MIVYLIENAVNGKKYVGMMSKALGQQKQWLSLVREKRLSSRLSKKKPVFGFDVPGTCVVSYVCVNCIDDILILNNSEDKEC